MPYVGQSPLEGLTEAIASGAQIGLGLRRTRLAEKQVDEDIKDAERRWSAYVSQLEFNRQQQHFQNRLAEQDQTMQRGRFESDQLTDQLQRKAATQQMAAREKQDAAQGDIVDAEALAGIHNLTSLAERFPEMGDQAMNAAGVMSQIKTPEGRAAYAQQRYPVLMQQAQEIEKQRSSKFITDFHMKGFLSDGANDEGTGQFVETVRQAVANGDLTGAQGVKVIQDRAKEMAERDADVAERTEGTQTLLDTYLTMLPPGDLRKQVRARIAGYSRGVGEYAQTEQAINALIKQAIGDTMSEDEILRLVLQRQRAGGGVDEDGDPVQMSMDEAEADVRKRLGGQGGGKPKSAAERKKRAQEIANEVRANGGTKEDLVKALRDAGLQ